MTRRPFALDLKAACVLGLAASTPALAMAQTTGASAPATSAPPPAASQNEDEDPIPRNAVVVHLYRVPYQALPGAVVGDIEPDVILQPEDVMSFGVSTVADLMNELAPQTASIQGRGGEQPVVLLNGKRVSSFAEIRSIPVEAILRVDILPEEVALKYGYTADQRVVNIVLRPHFKAITAEGDGGGDTDGGQVNGSAEGDQFRVDEDSRTNFDIKYTGSS